MDKEEYKSYLEELSPFKNEEQKKAVILAHLHGLQGQLETLMSWKNEEKAEYRKYYESTFGHVDRSPRFEALYKRLSEILAEKGDVDQAKYDEIYKEYELLSKFIGK